MKKLMLTLVALFTLTVSTTQAMSYEQARQQALFLTDKMAYELNLTDDQYEAAYEVNLDYLMGVDDYDDVYGVYWRQRNTDLGYILLDWQWRAFVDASYFYRPLYWDGGYWHFGIYARYPRRDYFFFGRPAFFAEYHGGHSWHMNGGRSWYHGRTFGGPRPGGAKPMGMRDGFQRGDFGRGQTFGNMSRQSSTRTTAPRNNSGNFNRGGQQRQSFGNMSRQNSGSMTRQGAGNMNRQGVGSMSRQSMGGSSQSSSSRSMLQSPSSSFGGGRSSSPSFGGGSHSGSFGNGARGGSSFGGGGGNHGGGFGGGRR